MIHQPTLTPAEFRRTPLWQSIAPAIAHATSGAALAQQHSIAASRLIKQAGANLGMALVELDYACARTKLGWTNQRTYPWLLLFVPSEDESIISFELGHAETYQTLVLGEHPRNGLSIPLFRAERTLIHQARQIDLALIHTDPSDARQRRFLAACNPLLENHGPTYHDRD